MAGLCKVPDKINASTYTEDVSGQRSTLLDTDDPRSPLIDTGKANPKYTEELDAGIGKENKLEHSDQSEVEADEEANKSKYNVDITEENNRLRYLLEDIECKLDGTYAVNEEDVRKFRQYYEEFRRKRKRSWKNLLCCSCCKNAQKINRTSNGTS